MCIRDSLHDPYLLHDMDKAVARIRQAIENYEQILVYGDYDADGMTSASIVKEALEMMGEMCIRDRWKNYRQMVSWSRIQRLFV